MRSANRVVPWATAGGLLLGALVAARRYQHVWGATPEEAAAPLPGDPIIGRADLVATRAVSIQAPPEDVWPWLVQLGQGRGGFYSYDRLQSLLGLDIDNAAEIVPEWQHLAPGDEVHLAPDVPLVAAVVDPAHALVLHGSPEGAARHGLPMPVAFTWAFVLRPGPRGSTRLVVRERYTYLEPWAGALVEAVQVASFVMTERMLRGIRERAEYRPPAEAVAAARET
ncbi:SRPBCC family protein [Georgenia satyanarayanai]|uniref:SRPBCC family protein n=1 Tax=Georgenia satyanarayanai TaxID=860221 RepID=UPI0012647ECF|nr:SRPBCC family protein [Georgenia satyanarayanai]